MPTSEAPSVIVARERGKTPPNKKWSLSTTQSILRNPKYAGYAYYAPVDSRGKCRSYNSTWRDYIVRDENGEIVKGTTWEPIVAEDVWWECQERRDSNLSRADGTHIEKKGNQKKHIGAGVYPLRDLRRQGEEPGRPTRERATPTPTPIDATGTSTAWAGR